MSPFSRLIRRPLVHSSVVLVLTGAALVTSAGPAAAADTTPPPTPTIAKVVPGDRGAQISWNAVSAADLDHYTIYASKVPNGTPVASWRPWSGTTSWFAGGLVNGQTYYFRVFAADRSKNTSAPSAAVPARLFPAVEYHNQDEITTAQTWGPSRAGQYIINAGLTIGAGGSLTIEPGTVIRFTWEVDNWFDEETGELRTGYFRELWGQPTLWVMPGGTLRTNGTTAKPVVFTSADDIVFPGAEPGEGSDWNGIVAYGDAVVSGTYTQLRHDRDGFQRLPAVG